MTMFSGNKSHDAVGPPAEAQNGQNQQLYDETVERTKNAQIDEHTRRELLSQLQTAAQNQENVGPIAQRLDSAIGQVGPEAELFRERVRQQKKTEQIANTPGLRSQTTAGGTTALTSEYRRADNKRVVLTGGQ